MREAADLVILQENTPQEAAVINGVPLKTFERGIGAPAWRCAQESPLSPRRHSMNYQFLPQPDPDLEPVSTERLASLMETVHKHNQRRQVRRRATAAIFFVLVLVASLPTSAPTDGAEGGLQRPPMATKRRHHAQAPSCSGTRSISDSSPTTQYVNDPVRTGTDSEPEEYTSSSRRHDEVRLAQAVQKTVAGGPGRRAAASAAALRIIAAYHRQAGRAKARKHF